MANLQGIKLASRPRNFPRLHQLVRAKARILATVAQCTPSSLRSGSSMANFFRTDSYGIFNTYSAGQNILIDFKQNVVLYRVTYRNAVGMQWAPTQVAVEYSHDGSVWMRAKIYTDDGTTKLQTIDVSSTIEARFWRLLQVSATRQNSDGYEWHMGNFSASAGTT